MSRDIMSREINNKLNCCKSENEKWCKSALDMIPYQIKQIKEKQERWGERCKNIENQYNLTKTNLEREKKKANDMKKYIKYIINKENKKMKELNKDMKNCKETIKGWDKDIADYKKQLKIFKKRVSVCNKKARCPNGTRKNRKNGKCEKK